MAGPTTSYSTSTAFLQALPTWIQTKLDQERVASYNFYDDLVANNPGDFKLLIRGDAAYPIYVPTARKLVKTMARYVARDLGFAVEADNTTEQANTIIAFGDLFNREKFFANFARNKRAGLTRGDMCIYLLADPNKPEGKRISIRDLHPGTYFPIPDPTDPERILGADIVEQVSIDDKPYVRRQRYIKSIHPSYPGYNPETPNYDAPVIYESLILEQENWQTAPKTFQVLVKATPLPDGITALPIYHIKMWDDQGIPFGRSILQGMERIFLALNQGATDEDVAVAMAGLGMYRSAATPVDDDGNASDWVLGPNRVVETDDFERIDGISSLDVSQDHMKFLQAQAYESVGVNDVALGLVDTQVAESGVALAIRMGPIIDESAEIDLTIEGVLTQLFHDLMIWLNAYEGINFSDTTVVKPVFGPKLPPNIKEIMDRLAQLYLDQVISLDTYHNKLRELGFDIPKNEAQNIANEAAARAQAAQEALGGADPFAQRLGQEQNPPADQAQ